MKGRICVLLAAVFLVASAAFGQNAQNMTLLGKYSFPSITAVTVSGKLAYITQTSSYGLYILDLSNIASPSYKGSFSPSGSPYLQFLYLWQDKLFMGSTGPDLYVVDVSNPEYPKQIKYYEEYAYDMRIVGNRAYLAAATEGLVILDVSNLPNISELGSYEPDGDAYGIAVRDTLAFLAYGGYGLRVVNMADTFNPVEIATFDTPGDARKVCLVGNYAYVADWNGGLRVIDVSNPKAPVEVGHYPPDPNTQPVQYWDVMVVPPYAYVADAAFGVRAIDVSNPGSPQEVASYRLGNCSDIFVVKDTVYAAWSDGLAILKNDLAATGVKESPVPRNFALLENYPNPVRDVTTFRFVLPRRSTIALRVYDVTGRLVATVAQGTYALGEHTLRWNASALPSGTYFYRLSWQGGKREGRLQVVK